MEIRMIEKFEEHERIIELDGEYIDVIGLKTISEMDDPVLSPNTGHVYDKVDIVEWLSKSKVDPLDNTKFLSVDMLVPGQAVKKISEDSIKTTKKNQNDFMKMFDEMNARVNKLEISNKSLIKTVGILQDENALLKEQNHQITKQLSQVTGALNQAQGELDYVKGELKHVEKECAQTKEELNKATEQLQASLNRETLLIQENRTLRQENEQLKKGYINPIWHDFGSKIDQKIDRCSTLEKKEALKLYSSKIKSCLDDDELKEAVNDIKLLQSEEIKKPYYFPFFDRVSETSKVVTEFKDKVTELKKWQPS